MVVIFMAPSLITLIYLYESDWLSEYQVVQESLDSLKIRIGCNRPPGEDELKAIRSVLHKGLLPDMKIDFDLGCPKNVIC